MSIEKYVSGSAQPKLNQKSLRLIKFPLPPLDIQREIVAEIEGYQNEIEELKSKIEEKEKQIQKKIAELCGEG